MLSRSSGIKLTISCNGKEVLNLELSDTTCTDSRITNWSRDVDMIEFRSSDTASDYYRPGTQNIYLFTSNHTVTSVFFTEKCETAK